MGTRRPYQRYSTNDRSHKLSGHPCRATSRRVDTGFEGRRNRELKSWTMLRSQYGHCNHSVKGMSEGLPPRITPECRPSPVSTRRVPARHRTSPLSCPHRAPAS